MIRKFKSIDNLAVFNGFDWDKEVRHRGGGVQAFQDINIIYGRNYSGKTTLSRIVRAMETGHLSDKFENPAFTVAFADGTKITEKNLTGHGKTIRVFNEDFIRDNLQFISNPDECIESFAILGDDNNKIETEIQELEKELGSKEEGKETGLYARKIKADLAFSESREAHQNTTNDLEKKLGAKATDRKIGIKYRPDRFGDQNYNIKKLKEDIGKVLSRAYSPPSDEQISQHEKLITEKTLEPVPAFRPPEPIFSSLSQEVEALVTKKISESDKIEELVKDAILNRWVNDGLALHKGKREHCAFCGNQITTERWARLEKHFDEESEQLEKNIDKLLARIDAEKNAISSAAPGDKIKFYSKFHHRLDELNKAVTDAIRNYIKSLEALSSQLKARKDDILNQKIFVKPDDVSADLVSAWESYKKICIESNEFSDSLSAEQEKAREALRLKEIADYLLTIQYSDQLAAIEKLKRNLEQAERDKNLLEEDIRHKKELIAAKKRELNDEEKGAKKVNEYLNDFFGHQFLSLEAKQYDSQEEGKKKIRFEVIRDGKKAYHLSEGECSLLAFCYFLAKLDDIETVDSKPIIWIDDPISSLDGNHIFFVYSLINTEIISTSRFAQLFVSTHSLDFLKYLKRLEGKHDAGGTKKDYQRGYFIVSRLDKNSSIGVMPKYLKEYVTEFNYLFHQIYKCAAITSVDDSNYTTFYNFANNARKFFEIYLYYKYPDQGMTGKTLCCFFGEEKVPAVLTSRINNEYSHLSGVFERGSTPVEVPEMQTAARQIIERLKEDKEQFASLLKSIDEPEAVDAPA